MPSHRLTKSWKSRLKSAVPFGLGQIKPKHFRDMAAVAWKNRDNLSYAWRVLSQGVCDGCALGVAGFHDWTIEGVHLCMTRLNLLRLNTMPAFDPQILEDVSTLKNKSNAELRALDGFRIRWFASAAPAASNAFHGMTPSNESPGAFATPIRID